MDEISIRKMYLETMSYEQQEANFEEELKTVIALLQSADELEKEVWSSEDERRVKLISNIYEGASCKSEELRKYLEPTFLSFPTFMDCLIRIHKHFNKKEKSSVVTNVHVKIS